MLGFQWNALRVGDRVLVHDDDDPSLTVHDGVVALVQVRGEAANDLAIRMTGPSSEIVRPRRHAVHMAPLDRRYLCWRCDEIATRDPGSDQRAA